MSDRVSKAYSGTEELPVYWSTDKAEFDKLFPGYTGKVKRYDAYTRLVGRDQNGNVQPVTRIIDYKWRNPSLHKCDGRCLHAKGGNCECSCGGQFHGSKA